MKLFNYTLTLLASASLLAMSGLPSAALAQASSARSPENALEEVVVTASRTSSTVNKVAMSVSAVTQKTMEAQGIKTIEDITRTVPGMTFKTTSAEGNPSVILRGIGGYVALVGAATTGIYLDDTPLTQRNLNGARTGNGSPFPQLFDLDRVEVLRGPQGTLYGGSSEGGTVRFITPTPNLSVYSGQARSTLSMTANGGPSGEQALAVGGPIIQDKLGFRISAVDTHDSGFIDARSAFDGHTFAKDVNSRDAYALRGALKWQASASLIITPAVYFGQDHSKNPDLFWLPTPQQNYAGGKAYNGAPAPELGAAFATGACSSVNSPTPASGACKNTFNGVTYFYAFPNTTVAPHVQAATPWYNGYSMGNGDYTVASNPVFHKSPRTTDLFVPTLTIEKDLGFMSVKSITSYTNNTTQGYIYQGLQGSSTFRYISRFMVGSVACDPTGQQNQPRGTNGAPAASGLCYQNGLYAPGVTDWQDYFFFNQNRKETTEELRFSSAPGGEFDGRLSWVGGAYYSDSNLNVRGHEETNDNIYTQRLRGVPVAWFAGAYGLPSEFTPSGQLSPPAVWSDIADRTNFVHEREYALFGEANFNITSKLKVTAGVRLSDYDQNYRQILGGYQPGPPPAGTSSYNPNGFVPNAAALQAASRDPTKPNSATNPIVNTAAMAPFPTDLAGCPTSTSCPLQYTTLHEHEKTTAPKLGLSYQLNDTDLLYFTYAKGFRPGGVNPPLPPITCAVALSQLGLTESPATYDQDSVNSYELGSKVRLFGGRVQLNAAAFMIDWVNMQTSLAQLPSPCGFQLVINAAHAQSKGGELQATGRFGPITLGANIGYDKAAFSQDVKNNVGILYFNKGDTLGSPDWTVALNGQYGFRVYDQPGFVRLDYAYSGQYQRGPGPGPSAYNPYTQFGSPTQVWNGRLGLTYKKVDWSLFVLNLTDTHTYQNLSGGTTVSADPPNATANSLRPRTIGLQANYRF